MKHIFNCIFILVSLNLFAQEYANEVVETTTWAEDSVATVAVEWADVALEDHGSGFALPFGTTGFTLILLCVGAIAVIAYKKIRKSIQPTASVPAKAGEEPFREQSYSDDEETITVTASTVQTSAPSQVFLPKGYQLKGTINDYIVKSVLGQGSFGITYLAYVRHNDAAVKSVNTLVAVKEFYMKDINGREGSTVTASTQEGLFDKYRNKFANESKLIHSLSHSGIVKVLDCFAGNNTFYYVMEYVEGGSLNDYIEVCGHIQEEESLRYARTIGMALDYMHGHNMVHLDIKPSNIMITKDGEAVLIDFGLSKQYDENGIPESSTSIGGGTPGYAPIEQATFHSSPDLPVTMDVYALGATLFKMLTGTRPPEASSILNEGFPAGDLLRYNVSDNTFRCIEKAMAPMRKSRYQDVLSFIQDLADESTIRL